VRPATWYRPSYSYPHWVLRARPAISEKMSSSSHLNKIITEGLVKCVVLCSGFHLKGLSIPWSRNVNIHREPTYDGYTPEHRALKNPLNHSGASEANIRTRTHRTKRKHVFRTRGGWGMRWERIHPSEPLRRAYTHCNSLSYAMLRACNSKY
jgi:hypothetical protein